jgi:hypothetical protein
MSRNQGKILQLRVFKCGISFTVRSTHPHSHAQPHNDNPHNSSATHKVSEVRNGFFLHRILQFRHRFLRLSIATHLDNLDTMNGTISTIVGEKGGDSTKQRLQECVPGDGVHQQVHCNLAPLSRE